MINEELREELISIRKNETISEYVNLINNVLCSNNIDCVDKDNNTLLIWSTANFSSLKLMELILKNGANINYQGYWGRTALMRVSQDNKVDKAKILLNYNPNLSLKNRDGFTALEIARNHNSKEVEELLIEYMNNNNQLVSVKNDEEDFNKTLIKKFNDAKKLFG